MSDRVTNTNLLYLFSVVLLIVGLSLFLYKEVYHDSRAGMTLVDSGPILVVDPVVINTSLREYLLKKTKEYGEKGLMEEIGIGKRTAQIISEIAGNRPVFVLQAIPNCLSQKHGEIVDPSICIDITDKVLERMGLKRSVRTLSTFEEVEDQIRIEMNQ